ncbi:Alpha/Beta hydrolase protein [Lentinula lateritia]|uniref:Alpha/Beta hydrolase protein n=1 Tax=Lentinula lateritia TaxID=40482 RepID=A0ABQ8V1J9_9AGAR|nr:Alpha/Beta hydrolase protein [Lentinula lateritia]
MTSTNSTPLTFTYKTFETVPIRLDLYPPTVITTSEVPTVLWFHGGGFTFANRTNFFPKWLQKRINDAGFAFVSADYRLIPTGSITAHDILEDVKDAFAFLRSKRFEAALDSLDVEGKLPFSKFRIDPRRIAAAESSAGGTCAYFAATHVEPKPAAILSVFGMGGDILNAQYLTPKTEPFLRGRPLLDPSRSKDYIYPLSPSVSSDILSDSPMAFHPPTATLPALPANPRMPLALLYLQLGTYLDYYTGEHAPSLSDTLRVALPSPNVQSNPGMKKIILRKHIPIQHHAIFPQLNVSPSWPPVFLLHGAEDTAVPVTESKNMYATLKWAGVETKIKIVDGEDHFFDQIPDAEEKYGQVFDEAAKFLIEKLSV